MAARAIWKGRIQLGKEVVPVKLYSAVEDKTVRFRLLHEKDKTPVKQAMVNPDSGEVVESGEILRAFQTENDLVVLDKEELEKLTPAPSRDINVISFLPASSIDHRWYNRSYYLGPDGEDDVWLALADALASSGREGLVNWVMRNKEYFGALSLRDGYPVLTTLRHREEVVSLSGLRVPAGRDLDKKELAMAEQLLSMLEDDFEPESYRDEYRDQVMKLIESKAKGGKVKTPRMKTRKPRADLSDTLEASLKAARAEKRGRKRTGKQERKSA